jgi:hypothetical protein
MIDYVASPITLRQAFDAAYDQANEELARVDANLNRLKQLVAALGEMRTRYPGADEVQHTAALRPVTYLTSHVIVIRPDGCTVHLVCNGALGAVVGSNRFEVTQ